MSLTLFEMRQPDSNELVNVRVRSKSSKAMCGRVFVYGRLLNRHMRCTGNGRTVLMYDKKFIGKLSMQLFSMRIGTEGLEKTETYVFNSLFQDFFNLIAFTMSHLKMDYYLSDPTKISIYILNYY